MRNGTFQFRCEGEPGRLYRFEASVNLLDWTSVGSFTPDSATFYVTDPSANQRSTTYYRMLTE